MKKLCKILFLMLVTLLVSCKGEDDVAPANESTFVRYLGTVDNNSAVLALETPQGFALLSNSESEQGIQKIRLTQTDPFGHVLSDGEKNYPGSGENSENWKAASFIKLESGYLIVGDRIHANGTTDLLLFQTDDNGDPMENRKTIITTQDVLPGASGLSLHGRAVMQDTDGNYLVLAHITGDPSPTEEDMIVVRIGQDFSLMWTKKYGAGLSTTISRIYSVDSNEGPQLLWGGSVRNATSNRFDVRLIKVPAERESVIVGGPMGEPDFDETAFDLCKSIGGWAFTGATNVGGTDAILVMKVTGTTAQSFTLEGSRGVSISSTNDAGLVVLGETFGQASDLTIAKLSLSGSVLWQHNYGGSDRQEAASVRQTSDGGYLVFATTYFVNEKKLMLIKLDRNGKL